MKHVMILKANGVRGWLFYWEDTEDFAPSQFDHNELVWKLVADFLGVAPSGFIGGDLLQYVSDDLFEKLQGLGFGANIYDATEKLAEYIAEYRDDEF
jgi:hypothetical protein